MGNGTGTGTGSIGGWAVGLFPVLFLLAFSAGAQEPVAERISETAQYRGNDRSPVSAAVANRHAPLVTDGARVPAPAARDKATKTAAATSAKARSDFWFYDVDVLLFNDDDGDGYYHGIDVLFDVDTLYDAADVYAVLYLSLEGGPWNEYAVTDTFRVFGATADDEYVVVTELRSGYPTGSYDLLIELYDAWTGEFLTDIGPADHSALAWLPLEDFHRDDPRRHRHSGKHGGGSMSSSLLLFLAALAAWRVRRRGIPGSIRA